jgi:iron complex outermembrane receptor protein
MGAGAAQAQTGAVSAVEVFGARTGGLNLTEPVTTGSRLGLTPLETPASIEVLSGDTIRARGDLSLADAIARSTGIVQQNNPGNGSTASFAARGFSGVGSVMTLFDGMRLFVGAGTVTFPFDPWTVERVEVLKGPASVLYGQGAIGGAVNVVPKRPSFGMASYDVQAGIGSDSTYRLAVGAGGPVNEALAYRVDISRVASDGYVQRGQSDSWALSGAVTWRPQENLSFTLSNDYGDQEPIRYFGVPLINGVIDKRSRELNYNVLDSIIHYRDNATQLRTEWEPAEGIKVRNSLNRMTTKRQWRNVESYFYDPASNTVDRTDYIPIKHDQRQIGDTLDATFKGRLGAMENTLTVGGEANKVRFVHTNDGFPGTTTTVNPFVFDPGLYIETGSFIPRYRSSTTQLGVFAEDQLKLTPELSLVGGLRYDHYRVRRQDLVNNARVVNKVLENTSWRLGLVYQPSPNLSFYAQYATGADPLGSLITTNITQAAFDLTTGRQYEVGAKGVFLGGRGEWTVAAYKIVKDKLLARVPNSPNLVQQVGQSSSKGLEASLSVQLAEGLSLDANGTVLDAEFDDFTDFAGGVGVSRNGKTPPNVPEETANLWLNWTVVPQVRFYGGVRYVGKQYGDNANTASLILPSYTVVDAGVEWRVRPNLALNLQVFNAFDKVYGANAYNNEQWILGRPRAFELRLNGRF